MKNIALFLIILFLLLACKKEEKNFEFKQICEIETTHFSANVPTSTTYRAAITSNHKFEDVRASIVLTLDSSTYSLSTDDLGTWYQMGYYSNDYPEKYWIATYKSPINYPFASKDIKRITYKGEVKIEGKWYYLPEESRSPNDWVDKFWYGL